MGWTLLGLIANCGLSSLKSAKNDPAIHSFSIAL
jgi:hypothetical protein